MTDQEQDRRKRLLLFGILTVLVMGMIFAFSAQSGEESSGLSQWFLNSRFGQILLLLLPKLSEKGRGFDLRKYAHMGEFCLLCLVSFPFIRDLFYGQKKSIIFPLDFLFCFLYACSDEWHQTFIPQRSGRFTDVLIDCVGILFGLLLHNILWTMQERSKNGDR